MDSVTTKKRSQMMSGIRSRNTQPEMFVRSLLHRMGHRFRLHVKGLPGRPDIVFPSRLRIIQIHGCFWHAHDCAIASRPKSRLGYWIPKLRANRLRDRRNRRQLVSMGWRVLEIWECEVRAGDVTERLLARFLGRPPAKPAQQATRDTRSRRTSPVREDRRSG